MFHASQMHITRSLYKLAIYKKNKEHWPERIGVRHLYIQWEGYVCVCVCVCVWVYACVLNLFISVWLCVTPWTVAHQAPLSMGFSRQECWSGLPRPPPGPLSNPGIEPVSLKSHALAGGFLTTSVTWEAYVSIYLYTHLIRFSFHWENEETL